MLEDESRNRGGGEHFGDALANVTLRAQSESDGLGDGSDSDAANSNASDMSVTNFGSLAEFTTNAGGTGPALPPANYAKLGLAGPLSAPGPFASHLPGLFEPTGCAVVGHRGFGMNRVSGKGIRENTVASFIAAHGSGAGWCEFDVQVTSDGVPVLFHDNLLLVRYGFGPVLALSIRELDLAELKAMSRAAIATAKAALAGDPDAIAAAAGVALGHVSTLQNQKSMSKLNKQQVDDDEDDEDEDAAKARPDVPVVFYRKFPNTETPAPWIMDVEDEIPTLEELMVHAPPELGLSMELKVRAFPNPNPASTFAHIRTRRDYYL